MNYPLSLDSTLKTLVLLNIATNLITLLEEKKPLARSLSLLTTHLITGEVKDLLSIPFSFKKHKEKTFQRASNITSQSDKNRVRTWSVSSWYICCAVPFFTSL